MNENKWIYFDKQNKITGHKTDMWIVWTKDRRTDLGQIQWFGRWRGYAFFPSMDTVYEEDCLRDIASFIEQETKNYREAIKKTYNLTKKD